MRVGLSAGLDPAFPSYYFRPSSNAFLSLLARVDASFVALPATLAVFSRAVGACRCAARTPRISVRHTQRQTANTRYRKTTVITPFTAASATLHSASDICCDPLCITLGCRAPQASLRTISYVHCFISVTAFSEKDKGLAFPGSLFSILRESPFTAIIVATFPWSPKSMSRS